jgi:hypothetical protein
VSPSRVSQNYDLKTFCKVLLTEFNENSAHDLVAYILGKDRQTVVVPTSCSFFTQEAQKLTNVTPRHLRMMRENRIPEQIKILRTLRFDQV